MPFGILLRKYCIALERYSIDNLSAQQSFAIIELFSSVSRGGEYDDAFYFSFWAPWYISWFTNKQRLVWFFIVSSLAFFFVIFLYNLYEYVCGWSGVRESAQASYLGRNIVDTRHFFASTFVCKMMKVWHLFWKIYLTRFFKLLLKNYCSKTWKISLCTCMTDYACLLIFCLIDCLRKWRCGYHFWIFLEQN